MMRANVERQYDEYERMAVGAIMNEGASRAKRPKASDLFKRPDSSVLNKNELADKKQEADRMNEWLSNLTRKEETDE